MCSLCSEQVCQLSITGYCLSWQLAEEDRSSGSVPTAKTETLHGMENVLSSPPGPGPSPEISPALPECYNEGRAAPSL